MMRAFVDHDPIYGWKYSTNPKFLIRPMTNKKAHIVCIY